MKIPMVVMDTYNGIVVYSKVNDLKFKMELTNTEHFLSTGKIPLGGEVYEFDEELVNKNKRIN